jgi:hypothetical protein
MASVSGWKVIGLSRGREMAGPGVYFKSVVGASEQIGRDLIELILLWSVFLGRSSNHELCKLWCGDNKSKVLF